MTFSSIDQSRYEFPACKLPCNSTYDCSVGEEDASVILHIVP